MFYVEMGPYEGHGLWKVVKSISGIARTKIKGLGLKLRALSFKDSAPTYAIHKENSFALNYQNPQWLTIFGGSKITADGDFSHEIKKHLLLGRKVMTNLDSVLESKDITLPTKSI